jgi:hypothetical protein
MVSVSKISKYPHQAAEYQKEYIDFQEIRCEGLRIERYNNYKEITTKSKKVFCLLNFQILPNHGTSHSASR